MNRRSVRTLALTAVGGVLLAACNVTLTLDTENLERNIQAELQRQLQTQNPGLSVSAVDCPERPIQVNDAFTCRATTSQGDVTIRVTQTDDQGNVHWVTE